MKKTPVRFCFCFKRFVFKPKHLLIHLKVWQIVYIDMCLVICIICFIFTYLLYFIKKKLRHSRYIWKHMMIKWVILIFYFQFSLLKTFLFKLSLKCFLYISLKWNDKSKKKNYILTEFDKNCSKSDARAGGFFLFYTCAFRESLSYLLLQLQNCHLLHLFFGVTQIDHHLLPSQTVDDHLVNLPHADQIAVCCFCSRSIEVTMKTAWSDVKGGVAYRNKNFVTLINFNWQHLVLICSWDIFLSGLLYTKYWQ